MEETKTTPMYDHEHDNEVVPFAQTNFRNAKVRFGIKTDDRRRHMYVVGKTGMGKTNLLRTLILKDIEAGHGVGLIDPHGDFAEEILQYIPANRINDVVYFNPADMEYPMGFNVLEAVDERYKHLVAAGMMGVFKKIWPDVWSPRMEYIMNSCLLALLDYPGSTMLGINRLLVDKEYRRLVISKIKDPVVKSFWVNEYASYADKFRTEAIAPIQNKVGQFLSTTIIRNIVAQVKSSINPRDIMDTGKIFIMNLSKGRIGEDASRLIGGLLITKLQLAAMERVDMPEKDRRDFYLYVDEFQNFATESFANILSEARKYRLNLLVAHQYIEQLDEKVAAAVFGNVGTMICFRVGGADSLILEKEFEPHFMGTDLVNLAKWDVYMKLMIDGVASTPFSASTLAPESKPTGNEEKVIKVSRERYAEKRAVIEEKVNRWSGFDGAEGEDGGAEKSKHDQGRPQSSPFTKGSERDFSDGEGRGPAPQRGGGGFASGSQGFGGAQYNPPPRREPPSSWRDNQSPPLGARGGREELSPPPFQGGGRVGDQSTRREPLPTWHDDYAPQPSSAPAASQRRQSPPPLEGGGRVGDQSARREPLPTWHDDYAPQPSSAPAASQRRQSPPPFQGGGKVGDQSTRREPPRRDADRWTGAHRHPTPPPIRRPEQSPPKQDQSRDDSPFYKIPQTSFKKGGIGSERDDSPFSKGSERDFYPAPRIPHRHVSSISQRGELVPKPVEEKPLSLSALAEKSKTETREKHAPRQSPPSSSDEGASNNPPPSEGGGKVGDQSPSLDTRGAMPRTEPKGSSTGDRGELPPPKKSIPNEDKKSGSLKPGETVKFGE